MKKHWVLIALAICLVSSTVGLQAGALQEEEAIGLAISGHEWLQGHFNSTFYSEVLDGLTLTTNAFVDSWELELPAAVVLDVVTNEEGYAYVAGAKRTDGGWGEWLGAFDLYRHMVVWRSPEPAVPHGKWAQAVAVDQLDNGSLIVTGWSGDSVLLSAFTTQGRLLWRREVTFGEESAVGLDVLAFDNTAYVIGTGQIQGRPCGFLARCDSDGVVVWSRLYDQFESLISIAYYRGSLVCLAVNGDKSSLIAFSGDGEILWQVGLPTDAKPIKVIDAYVGLFVLCGKMLHEQEQGITIFRLAEDRSLKRVAEYLVDGLRVKTGALSSQGGLWVGGWKGEPGVLLRWDSEWQLVQEETLRWGESSRVQGIAEFPGGCVVVGMARSNATSRAYLSVWQAEGDRRSGTYVSRVQDWGAPVEPSFLWITVEGLDLGKVQVTLETSQDGFTSVSSRQDWVITEAVQKLEITGIEACSYSRIVLQLDGGPRGTPLVKELRINTHPRRAAAPQPGPTPEEEANHCPTVALIDPVNGFTGGSWADSDNRWHIFDPDGDTMIFYVYNEANNPDPTNLVETITGLTDGTLERHYPCEPGTTYYWKVVVEDAHGCVTESPVWQFTTTYPPNEPSNPSPSSGATGVAAPVELCWEGGDPDGETVSYKVYLDTNPSPTSVLGTFSSGGMRQCMRHGNLERGTTYYWKVEASDSFGTVSGPVWSFTTEELITTGKPIAVSPSVGSAKRTVFRFAVEGQASYPYLWDFGDGSTEVGNPVEHVYAQPGVYRVTVSSWDGLDHIGACTASVYRETGSWFGIKLPVLGNDPHFSCGDFDGNGRIDLISWMPGRRSFYLLEGSGDGRFLLRSNRSLPVSLTTLQVVDFDGDGLDDVLGFNLDKNKAWLLQGSPDGLLGWEQPIPIPLRMVYPLENRKGFVCLAQDEQDQNVIYWVRSEEGLFASRQSLIGETLPTLVALDLNDNGLLEQCLLGEQAGWVVWDTPRPDAASPLPGEALAVGEWDGDGVRDVLVRNGEAIELWSLANGRLAELAPTGVGHWTMLDCNGDGIDEVVHLSSQGQATFYFSKPKLEQLTVPLPFIPSGYTVIDLDGDLKEELLLYSADGWSIVFHLDRP